jgi:hypothetical protein
MCCSNTLQIHPYLWVPPLNLFHLVSSTPPPLPLPSPHLPHRPPPVHHPRRPPEGHSSLHADRRPQGPPSRHASHWQRRSPRPPHGTRGALGGGGGQRRRQQGQAPAHSWRDPWVTRAPAWPTAQGCPRPGGQRQGGAQICPRSRRRAASLPRLAGRPELLHPFWHRQLDLAPAMVSKREGEAFAAATAGGHAGVGSPNARTVSSTRRPPPLNTTLSPWPAPTSQAEASAGCSASTLCRDSGGDAYFHSGCALDGLEAEAVWRRQCGGLDRCRRRRIRPFLPPPRVHTLRPCPRGPARPPCRRTCADPTLGLLRAWGARFGGGKRCLGILRRGGVLLLQGIFVQICYIYTLYY